MVNETADLHPLLAIDSSVDPAPALAEIRESDPVHWIPGLEAWLATRHEDVKLLFADARLTTDPRVYERYQPPSAPGSERWLSEMPFRSTPSSPEVRGRQLVSSALTPRAVARTERRVAEVVEEHAAPLRDRSDVVDLVGEYTAPIARTVIGRILGVPPKGTDGDRFRQLASQATRGINPILTPKQRLKAELATIEICNYVEGLVAERHETPREDLISDLIGASKTAHATAEEIVRVIAALVAAGTGTTSLGMSRALRALLEHPDQLADLRDDRSLLPNAVSELLRYDCGLLLMPRYVLEDFSLRGKRLRRGQLVGLCIMAANRDPRVFDDPDRLDLRRETKDSLSFGYGPHHCIGANLARAEMQMSIDAALDFLPPGAILRADEIRWSPRGAMSNMLTLPVDFGGSA